MGEGEHDPQRLRRQRFADNAIESGRLSGYDAPQDLREDLQKWVAGEVSIDDLVARVIQKQKGAPDI